MNHPIKALEVRAPSRIDLAGGTLDMPPLYLLHGHGLTINIAIQKYARVWMRESDSFVLKSNDLKTEETFSSLKDITVGGELDLLKRVILYFKPERPFSITTEVSLPKGSGLAGSSTLMIALTTALSTYLGRNITKTDLITLSKSIETQAIKVPTGFQDYYPATYGGLTFLWLQEMGNEREQVLINKDFLHELERDILLSYTGEPHFSGTNNWQIFKDHIDGNKEVFKAMESIRVTAEKMREALYAEDLRKFAKVLKQDWENRKKLSPGVTTAKIERIINAAEKSGAFASRVCGAGGGGCMITVVDHKTRESVKEAMIKAGAEILDLRFDFDGVHIEI